MTCKVHLVAHTPRPDETVAAAARLCYSDVSVEELLESSENTDVAKFISRLRRSGHLSPFEHVSFTFGIDGLSRVCTHQLVRHRMASYSQQSQRYVSMDRAECVVPSSIEANEVYRSSFNEYVKKAHELYLEMIKEGIPKEDARYILPHGWQTRITLTMNARELHHFFGLRTCRRSQWEIREVARQMLVLVREAAPFIFEIAGPGCLVNGHCGELRSCGKPYRDMDELLAHQ